MAGEKPLRYSGHVMRVAAERRLELGWLESAVVAPDWVEVDSERPGMERRFKAVAERDGRFLRVVCVETDDEIAL